MNVAAKINQIIEVIENSNGSKSWNGFEGRLGYAIFYSSLFQMCGDNKYKENAINLLDLEVLYYNLLKGRFNTFWSGFSGLSWTIKYLSKTNLITNDYNICYFDPYLLKVAYRVMKKKNDFLNGSLGIFNSLIASSNELLNKSYAVKLIESLYGARIVKGEKSICWVQDSLHPNIYNLSLSHGMSSIVILLSKIHKKGVEREKCAELIEGAVNYILAQKLPQSNYTSVFGNYALECMEKPHSSRLAWCYGDLGIAVALWNASQALVRKDWENEAKVLLRHASARRDMKENGIIDACFCHGTSGIAHVFNRMWKETEMPECRDAAAYWISQTLSIAKFKDGLAGYKTWQGAKRGFQNEYGLLEGIVGIGLALLSYISEDNLTWDECLLLS